jgi:peptidyl-prolyl cis-trans isomerase SurA
MAFSRFLLTLSAIVLLSANSFAATKPQEQSLDQMVAIVNDSVITQTELDHAITITKRQMEETHTPLPSEAILRKQILDQLINRTVQLDLAKQAGIHITDEEVTKAINTIAQQNHVTVSELYQKVQSQGMTLAEYKKDLRDEITLQQIQQHEVASKITITPQEVNDFVRSNAFQAFHMKEYHLEDILIALPDAPSSEDVLNAKKHADEVLAKIRHGMSFTEASASESNSNQALQGGDLGWRKLPEIPAAFADQIVHMKTNDITNPIQAPNGFHLVHLAGIRNVTPQGNAETQHKEVEQLLYQRKFEEALQTWVRKIRSDSFVNLNPEHS